MKKITLQWMLERSHNHLQDFALIKKLENNGFDSILLRTSSAQPDPWTVATFYASKFEKIKFMVAVNPASISPFYCAIKIATFQKFFGNRISINIVSGASKAEQAMMSDSISIENRYARSAEFAEILNKILTEKEIYNYNGTFYSIPYAKINDGNKVDIVFAGSSDNTINLANNYGYAHYYSMETPAEYKETREKIKVKSAIKASILIEKTEQEAWEKANQLIKNIDSSYIDFLKKDLSSHESQNQKRQQSLHNFSKENLTIYKNIWAGLGLIRGGGITSIVGNYKECADIIKEYYDLGLDIILIAGTPEEYYLNEFIEGVIPILKEYGIVD